MSVWLQGQSLKMLMHLLLLLYQIPLMNLVLLGPLTLLTVLLLMVALSTLTLVPLNIFARTLIGSNLFHQRLVR